jgi:hypothetical protein
MPNIAHLHIAVRIAIEQQLLLDVGRQIGKHGLVARAQSRHDGGLGHRGAGRMLGQHVVDLVDQRVEFGDELDQTLREYNACRNQTHGLIHDFKCCL